MIEKLSNINLTLKSNTEDFKENDIKFDINTPQIKFTSSFEN